MGIGLPSISLSKYTLLIAVQAVVNVALAVWLYNEYVHNAFMRSYMSAAWAAGWPEAIIGAVATVAVVAGVAYKRGYLDRFSNRPAATALTEGVATSENLKTIDICPFCDLPLKAISEGRLQCRNCRRYYKSSLPKVAA